MTVSITWPHRANHLRKFASIIFTVVLSSNVFAEQKRYDAHQHGAASVNVVAEGKSVTVQLKTPANSIYGFEHKAKTKTDFERRDTAIAKLKSSAPGMFILDANLNCTLSSADVEPFVTDEHRSHAKFASQRQGNSKASMNGVKGGKKGELGKLTLDALSEDIGKTLDAHYPRRNKIRRGASSVVLGGGGESKSINVGGIAWHTHVNDKRSHKEKHNQKKKGTHAEVHATFKFACEKPVSGTSMSFGVQKHFQSVRTLKVQVLSGDKQSGLTVEKDQGSVSL